jgi:hypothetical protein
MATFSLTWFGVQVRLSENETHELITIGQDAVGVANFVAGIFPPAAPVAKIVATAIQIGDGALGTCDSAHRGVLLTILWIGLPWCTGL